MIISSNNAEETMKIGSEFAIKIKPGTVVCLAGGLGAGKTAFTKGFVRGFGLTDAHVTSPTFNIINIYENSDAKKIVYHFDVYRIEDISEMENTGYEDYFYGNENNSVCIVEWAEKIAELIPIDAIWVNIAQDPEKGADYRMIEING